MNKSAMKVIIFSIQESFVALFPYFITRAMVTLLQLINGYYDFVDTTRLTYGIAVFYDIFPILLAISLSIQLSKNFHISMTNFTTSSVVSFALVSGYFTMGDTGLSVSSAKSIFFAILVPITAIVIIIAIKSILSRTSYSPEQEEERSFLSSMPYIYFNIPATLIVLSPFSYYSNRFSEFIFSLFANLAVDIQALIHLLASHLMWLVGIHGTTVYHYLFDMGFYSETIYTNFSHQALFSTLVNFGGAGSTLSLIIAIYIASKSNYYKFVAKSSLPFSIFNINEPLIYGLPIVFNRRFALPFILTPLINFSLSMLMLELNVITIVDASIPWSTPPLISGYMLTNSLSGLFWQLFLIVLGVLIYIPFVRDGHSKMDTINQLKEKLSFDNKLNKDLQQFSYHQKQLRLKSDESKIALALKHITEGELTLHYQPQIDIRTNRIYGYEALLRLKKGNKIYPPTFLDAIEKSGLEEMIDMWTVKKVATDSKHWFHEKNRYPKISINIYPKTLLKKENIDTMIETLSGLNIQIELIEKGFKNNIASIEEAIEVLRKNNLTIALDDYGSKESNLTLLGAITADTIKLDMSLVNSFINKKGKILFLENCKTLKSLDIILVAEGVETQEELDFILSSRVDVVQGWYYSKALPLDEAIGYKISDKSSKGEEIIYPTL